LIDLIDRMTADARADGAIRPDITVDDVGLLMTVQIYAPPHIPREEAMRRTTDILLVGLRTPGHGGDASRAENGVRGTAEPGPGAGPTGTDLAG
jgi:hypothetical protein